MKMDSESKICSKRDKVKKKKEHKEIVKRKRSNKKKAIVAIEAKRR